MRAAGHLRRWLCNGQSPSLILLYHRVTLLDSDPQLLSVTPRHFSEHLDVLRRNYERLNVRDGGVTGARQPSVLVTFDDGYADNLHEALPILRAAEWPATVFVVATAQAADDQEFWWDELERVILRTPELPTQLRLTIGGSEHVWDIGDANRSSCPSWNVLGHSPLTPRQAVYVELASLLRGEEGAERTRILADLQHWANLRWEGRTSHRSLKADELLALVADGLVEVGAHTVSHPSLARLPESSQYSEILNSKLNLERILGHHIRSFSYPFGGAGDYNGDTIRLVKKAGFEVACANIPGAVYAFTDRYQLPRMIVRDWNGDEFARQLETALAS